MKEPNLDEAMIITTIFLLVVVMALILDNPISQAFWIWFRQ